MTIDRIYGQVVFTCDNCGETLDTESDDFGDALAVLATEGWRAERTPAGYDHKCPDCIPAHTTRSSPEDF